MKRLPLPTLKLSIRLQLTCWYTLVFATLTLSAGYLLYTHLQSSLLSTLDADLRIRSHQVANDISLNNGKLVFHNNTEELQGFDTDDTDDDTERVNLADVNTDVLARVLDAQGQQQGITPAFQQLHMPLESVTLPLHGTPWQGNILSTSGEAVRVYSRALTDDNQNIAVIQVGASLGQVNTALSSLFFGLLFIVPLTLCLSAVGSYFLASRTLRPISQVIRIAQRIKVGDLQQRIPLPDTRDEVQHLVTTLNEMLDALEDAFAQQRRFVADASHELRTPVAAIRSMIEVALLKASTPRQYETTLATINQEVARLGILLSDLLALARADEGQMPLQYEPIELHTFIATIVATTEPLATKHGLTLHVEIPHALTIEADEARLIQAIMNLLDNAMRYTPAGGSITLSVLPVENEVEIGVRDTGIGIEAEHLPHIFERFYRVDPAHTHIEGGGSGLGLSIVEWVVHAHNGSLSVESQPGRGSTFSMRLPQKEQSSPRLFIERTRQSS